MAEQSQLPSYQIAANGQIEPLKWESQMRVELDIPEYDPEHGLRLPVVFGAVIEAVRQPSELVIRANEAGLRLIAGQLLAMAQNGVPAGTHLHFDAGSGLEDGSAAFIVERTDRTV